MAQFKFVCGDNSNHTHTFSQMCRVCPKCGGYGSSKLIIEEPVSEPEAENA